MNLELKHLAPYLPYGLQTCYMNSNKEAIKTKLTSQNIDAILVSDLDYPILRPLTDLTNEIEVNGKKIVPINVFSGRPFVECLNIARDDFDIRYTSYGVVVRLLEWHFDVFGLIEQELAIDINSINL